MTMKFLEPEELAQWYANDTIKDTLIIDVGKLKGSVHIPFHTFPEAIVQEILPRLDGKSKVVFHCYFSQTRGPRAAKLFLDHLISSQESEFLHQNVEVFVLQGGWKTWKTFCSHNGHDHLIEPVAHA